ncbi:hypothetical protein [Planococcus beigongshangi]|uniref:hypothetical protein n=1 Tax=Planococcus beigongshangi TaxID=2782536 RepID=UPI00193B3213|nr:hypothetical protein [Planococcus beigongshangi]
MGIESKSKGSDRVRKRRRRRISADEKIYPPVKKYIRHQQKHRPGFSLFAGEKHAIWGWGWQGGGSGF